MRPFIAITCAIAAFTADVACAQSDYPNKPIRIVTAEPGGGSDFVSRLIAQGISDSLGQPAIVDNRAGGTIAIETVAKAQPDGYTVLSYGSVVWVEPLLRSASWDAARDFLPITSPAASPSVIAVHPSVQVASVKELIAMAKARPGELNYAVGGVGSPNHLAAELFKSLANVNIVRVNYKGTAPALNALIGGEVQLMFPTASSAIPHMKSGRLKALAVTSAEPSVLVPGLPTVKSEGVPGYESVTLYAVFAPAKTPAAIINRLNQEIVRAVNKPDVKEKLLNTGVEVVGDTPEHLAATMKADAARTAKVIKDAGISVQ